MSSIDECTVIEVLQVANGGDSCNTKNFDQRKIVDGYNVEKISVNSSVFDVNLIKSNKHAIEVHLYGQGASDEDFELEVFKKGKEVTITVQANCRGPVEGIRLDITFPKYISNLYIGIIKYHK